VLCIKEIAGGAAGARTQDRRIMRNTLTSRLRLNSTATTRLPQIAHGSLGHAGPPVHEPVQVRSGELLLAIGLFVVILTCANSVANTVLAFHLLGRNTEALELGSSRETRACQAGSAWMWSLGPGDALELNSYADVRAYLEELMLHIRESRSDVASAPAN
jgi:hypothetical protein